MNRFRDKTQKQAHRAIIDLSNETIRDFFDLGFEAGIQFKEAGFEITDDTPLYSEIFSLDFIYGFKKGFRITEVAGVLSEGLRENIPNSIEILATEDYYGVFSNWQNRLQRMFFVLKMENDDRIILSMESINMRAEFSIAWPKTLNESIRIPIKEIHGHIESKRAYFDKLVEKVNLKGYLHNYVW